MTAFHTYEQITELINASITLTARVTVRLHIVEHPGNFIFNVDIIAPSGNNTYPVSESSEYGHAYALAEDFYIRLAYLYENNDLVRIFEEIKHEKAGEPLPPLTDKKKVETVEVENSDKSTISDKKKVDKPKRSTYIEQPKPNPEVDAMLAGFEFTSNKGTPILMLGKRKRLYLKGDFKRVLGVNPQTRVIIGYKPDEDAFAVALPRALAGNYEAQAAGYFVSKKYDVTASSLFNQYRFNEKYELDVCPREYYFDKASSDASVAIFRRY